jgi:hypothetical protein
MNGKACNLMSVDDLFDADVRLAASLGSLQSRQFKPAEKTPERVGMRRVAANSSAP